MTTFNDFIKNPISEKVVLLWVEPKERILSGWSVFSGSVYQLEAKYFVIDVRVDGVKLNASFSTSLNAGEFYYNPVTGIVYVRLLDDSNPKLSFTSLDYRFFYSNRPSNLPYDLNTGESVEWLGLISTVSEFSSQLDNDDLTGISLTGTGTIGFNNNSGEFEEIYDKLFWEGARVKIYLWNPEIDVTESQIIYKGKVESKTYGESVVTFKLKDFVNELRNEIPLDVFSESDGVIPDSYIGKPKRRVYGQVDGLKCESLNQTLDGYTPDGTFTKTEENEITYSLSNLSDVIFINDIIIFKDQNNEDVEYRVSTVISDTVLQVSEAILISIDNAQARIRPSLPYRFNNREWLVSSHAIKSPETTILELLGQNRIKVASVADLFAGDIITVNSERKLIRRISSDLIVLDTNFQTIPSVGDSVVKTPIQSVQHENQSLVINRDYSVINTTGKCSIVLNDDAELNLTRDEKMIGEYKFSFNSAEVEVTGIDATTKLREKDWIRPPLTVDYFEIKEVAIKTYSLVDDFLGQWNATSNIPALTNGVGINGDYYVANNSGTQDFGAGPISFQTGDRVYYSTLTNAWDKILASDSLDIEIEGEYIVTLNEDFTGTSVVGGCFRKRPNYINERSNVTVTCLGKTFDGTPTGEWIRTGPKVVQDIIEEQDIENDIDLSTFDQAAIDAPYMISLALPLQRLQNKPTVKSIINKVNTSIFGSLHNDVEFNVVYNALTPRKPPLDITIKDDDIVGYSIKSSGKNVTRAVTGQYNYRDYDPDTTRESNRTLTVINDYIDKISDVVREEILDLHLYRQSDALIITQRYSLLREFSNLILNVKTKINLMDKNINDVIYFEFDRIFERYGTLNDKNRIGAISGIKKGVDSATITITDLSSMYNKVCTIAEASANIYVNSTLEERAVNGFYTDTFGLVNDDQHTNRMNLVG